MKAFYFLPVFVLSQSLVSFAASDSSPAPAAEVPTEVSKTVRTTVTTDGAAIDKNNPITDPNAAVAEVQALADAKKFGQAEAKARAFLKRDPTIAELHNLLGFSLRKQSKFSDSLASYQEAIKLKPDFPQAKEYLAVSYLNMKESKPALALYNELKTSHPNLAKMIELEAKRLKIKLK
jgi:tetratricopeptide (TPR) repeat protein